MKITLFTSNQARHLGLIHALSEIADLSVVMETSSVFPGRTADFYAKSEVMQRYFSRVLAAEEAIFGGLRPAAGVQIWPLRMGDLQYVDRPQIYAALDADAYVVFGASWIRGWLIEHLVAHRALNIHMGLSPWYRGTGCNFWALRDGNPHLVGATLHMLSKGLDSGAMLRHVRPKAEGCADGFEFTMRAVSAAHAALVEGLADGSLLKMEPVAQDKAQEVRYTRNAEFTDEVAGAWLDAEPGIDEIRADLAAAADPEFLRLYER